MNAVDVETGSLSDNSTGLHAGMPRISTHATRRDIFCLFNTMRFLSLQLDITIDLLPDDREAVIPELAFGDVDAKAFGQLCCSGLARGGQQVLVVLHECGAALLVDGIEPGGK